MKLSKQIPARTKTVLFKWVKKNFIRCDARYMEIRGRLSGRRRGTMISCDFCKRKFEEDEWFALAQTMPKQEGPKRNWALCHDCADSAMSN